MASGIYKRTLHRTSTGKSENTGTEEHPPDSAARQADGRLPLQGGAAGPTLIGNRTLYVDRQVERRARTRSKRKQIRRLKVLVTLLILSLIFVSMGWILSWAKLQEEADRRMTLDSELQKNQQELDKVQLALKARDAELADLVKNRIPGAERIFYNELLKVNDKYVLNITFSETGASEDKALEYHAMLANNSEEMVDPHVTIFVFNEFGLQVGRARLEKEQATGDVVLAELEAGETRSYHSRIDMEATAAPMYYTIKVE